MVGNGVADWDADVWPSAIELYYKFNMIPKSRYDAYKAGNCEEYFNDVKPTAGDDVKFCEDQFNWILEQIGTLNIYDLYRYQYAEGGL